MELTRTDAVSAELPWCYFCAEIKVLGMTRKSTEIIFGINKNTGERIKARGPTPCPRGWGRALRLHRPQLQLYIFMFGDKKNKREGFIAFYDTEPPPSPKLSQEG
jgi:hypothetical protein